MKFHVHDDFITFRSYEIKDTSYISLQHFETDFEFLFARAVFHGCTSDFSSPRNQNMLQHIQHSMCKLSKKNSGEAKKTYTFRYEKI